MNFDRPAMGHKGIGRGGRVALCPEFHRLLLLLLACRPRLGLPCTTPRVPNLPRRRPRPHFQDSTDMSCPRRRQTPGTDERRPSCDVARVEAAGERQRRDANHRPDQKPPHSSPPPFSAFFHLGLTPRSLFHDSFTISWQDETVSIPRESVPIRPSRNPPVQIHATPVFHGEEKWILGIL